METFQEEVHCSLRKRFKKTHYGNISRRSTQFITETFQEDALWKHFKKKYTVHYGNVSNEFHLQLVEILSVFANHESCHPAAASSVHRL